MEQNVNINTQGSPEFDLLAFCFYLFLLVVAVIWAVPLIEAFGIFKSIELFVTLYVIKDCLKYFLNL